MSFLSVADSFWTFRAYLKQLSSEKLSLTNQLIRVFNQPSETYYFLTLFFCITLFTILSSHFLLIGFFLQSPTREEGSEGFSAAFTILAPGFRTDHRVGVQEILLVEVKNNYLKPC